MSALPPSCSPDAAGAVAIMFTFWIEQEKQREKRNPPAESALFKGFLKKPHPVAFAYFSLTTTLTWPPQTTKEAGKCSFGANNVVVLNKNEVFLIGKREDMSEGDNSSILKHLSGWSFASPGNLLSYLKRTLGRKLHLSLVPTWFWCRQLEDHSLTPPGWANTGAPLLVFLALRAPPSWQPSLLKYWAVCLSCWAVGSQRAGTFLRHAYNYNSAWSWSTPNGPSWNCFIVQQLSTYLCLILQSII